MSDTKLFNEFPPISTQKWEEQIQKDLKGADYERKLVWRTNEGISVKPYYRSEQIENLDVVNSLPNEFPFLRGNKTANNEWEIRQDIDVDNAAEANSKALNLLNKGVTSLGFTIKNELSADEMAELLKDIALDCIEVNFTACCKEPVLIPLYIAEVKKRGLDTSKMKGSFNFDPLGCLITNGNYCFSSEDVAFEHLTESLNTLTEALPHYKSVAVNGKFFHNAGATIVQELAYCLSTAVEYMDKLTERGVAAADAAKGIKFNFAVGGNYFMEIAKFRAARLLWANIVNAYAPNNSEAAKMSIHAETSLWNKTIYDPYVNMLRTTTEAMSSVIAGIDSLTILPFDAPYGASSDFSERIARNQQILLKEEAYLDKTVDPASGSYYIESLTDSIANEAWKLFLATEEKGGFLKAIQASAIQQDIAQAAQKRDMNLAQRKEILLGTNQYPDFNEKVMDKIQSFENEEDCCNCSCSSDSIVEKLIQYRGAEAFETLRLKTEQAGKTPKVFMFSYGNLAMRKARSMFSANFFACAGFEILDNNGFASIEEGIAEVRRTKPEIVVICSSDEEYAEIALPVLEQLKNETIVVLAGYPQDLIEKLQQAGMKHFIHIKSNILESLQKFQKELGIN